MYRPKVCERADRVAATEIKNQRLLQALEELFHRTVQDINIIKTIAQEIRAEMAEMARTTGNRN